MSASNKTYEEKFEGLKGNALSIISAMVEFHDNPPPSISLHQHYDSIVAIKWSQPDQALANTERIAQLKTNLQRAWASAGFSEQYTAEIANAQSNMLWLYCELLQTNFPKFPVNADTPGEPADLTYRVEALETYKTGLEDHKWWEKKQIDSLYEQNADLKRDVKHWTIQTERAEQNLKQFKSDTDVKMAAMETRLKKLITIVDNKVDDALIKNATISTAKKGWLWAKMPPEAHTLPGLLAQLERPDTP
jgi:hypothetical protein